MAASKKPAITFCGEKKWRREWDSNPRLLRVTGFQDQLLKPLGHLSELLSSETLVIIPYAVMLVKCSLKNFHAIFPVKY